MTISGNNSIGPTGAYSYNIDAFGLLSAQAEKDLNKRMLQVQKSEGSHAELLEMDEIAAVLSKDSGNYFSIYSFLHSLKSHITDFSAGVQNLINQQSGELNTVIGDNPACSQAISELNQWEGNYKDALAWYNYDYNHTGSKGRKEDWEAVQQDLVQVNFWKGHLATDEDQVSNLLGNGMLPLKTQLKGEIEKTQANINQTEALERSYVGLGKVLGNEINISK